MKSLLDAAAAIVTESSTVECRFCEGFSEHWQTGHTNNVYFTCPILLLAAALLREAGGFWTVD